MPRKPHEKLPMSPSELEGVSKAAILLLAVGEEGAAAMGPGWTPRVELRAPELFDETHEAVAPALPGGAP